MDSEQRIATRGCGRRLVSAVVALLGVSLLLALPAAAEAQVPSHLVFILDEGGSTTGDQEQMENFAEGVVAGLDDDWFAPGGGSVGVVLFQNDAHVGVALTADENDVSTAIDGLTFAGGVDQCYSCAIDQATTMLAAPGIPASHRKAVVFITDGPMTNTAGERDAAVAASDAQGISRTAIGFDDALESELNQISTFFDAFMFDDSGDMLQIGIPGTVAELSSFPAPDGDADGAPDFSDNCELDANAGQENLDGDPQGDACDPDDDNDGVADAADACPTLAGTGSDGCTPPDATAPETTIDKKAKKKSTKRRPKFRFSSSEPGSRFECSFDGEDFASCESPLRQRLATGKHRFAVRAVDAAGNRDPTPASQRFKILRKK